MNFFICISVIHEVFGGSFIYSAFFYIYYIKRTAAFRAPGSTEFEPPAGAKFLVVNGLHPP